MTEWINRIEYLREAGDVKRCHVIRTVRHHSNATHTYGALCIALELCSVNDIGADLVRRVLVTLLVHDAPERDTGDMPADTKRASPELREAMQQLENRVIVDQRLPDPRLDAKCEAIVKAADSIDLGFAMLEERRAGNLEPRVKRTFDNILRYTLDQAALIEGVHELRAHLATSWIALENGVPR